MPQYCPIWGEPWPCNELSARGAIPTVIESSRAGGEFKYYKQTTSLYHETNQWEDDLKMKISRWIYEQNLLGEMPLIDESLIQQLKQAPMPPVSERIDALLEFIELRTRNEIGKAIDIFEDPRTVSSMAKALGIEIPESSQMGKIFAATSVSSNEELLYLLNESKDMELVHIERRADTFAMASAAITLNGYNRIEQLKNPKTDSSQAFVAMWFDPSMDDAWKNGFEPGIKNAGYKPIRIDKEQFNNKIDDEIIAEIHRSRFVVADFTSEPEKPRGGVYYEAGFAHGLNIPVIFTCREDLIDKVHFDTRQFKHITWSTPEDLRKQLKTRIQTTLGDGPLKKPTPP